MVKSVYVIYDMKAESGHQPAMYNKEGEAVRAFSELCNDKETRVGRYPEDFVMYQVATYDDETFKYTNLEKLKSFSALAYVKQDSQLNLFK